MEAKYIRKEHCHVNFYSKTSCIAKHDFLIFFSYIIFIFNSSFICWCYNLMCKAIEP